MKKNIGIQGIKGSFHHIVANNYFEEDINLIEYLSFEELILNLFNDKIDYAIMAIENSTAGSIIPNYALIDEYRVNIVGEYYLQITHNLIALKGQSIEDIKEVQSHPMALLQCRDFFKDNVDIVLIEDKDTAQVAKKISENKIKGLGAIASDLASKIYGLDIINDNIQTIKKNQTRFVILQKKGPTKNLNFNKASVKFELDHKRGSLAAISEIINGAFVTAILADLTYCKIPYLFNFSYRSSSSCVLPDFSITKNSGLTVTIIALLSLIMF